MANDVGILIGILLTLVLVGAFIPVLQNAIGRPADTYNTTDIMVVNPKTSSSYYLSIASGSWYQGGTGILLSIGTALFWVYNWFPFWLTAIHVVIRVIGGVLVYRLLRSGAG